MTLALASNEPIGRSGGCSFEPVLALTGEGLVFGDTVLAPSRRGRDGAPQIAIDGVEERILALLVVAYGKTVRPSILGNIRRAARYWRCGETDLAAIEIALSGLPPLGDQELDAARLLLGEELLAARLGPSELIELCGLDPAALGLRKADYNPDEPRVPVGNPDGGQWTSADDGTSPGTEGGILVPGVTRIDPNIEFAAYTLVHGLPNDAVAVTTPDGRAVADPDSKTKKLMAPPGADYRKVYAAGRSIASLPPPEQYSQGRTAIAQGEPTTFSEM